MTKKNKTFLAIFLSIIMLYVLMVISIAAPVNYGDELEGSPDNNPSISFSDIKEKHWGYQYITELAGKKVINGYPDGKFRPDDQVTRAEFAKIIVTAAGLQVNNADTSSFSDVKTTDWYCPFIETAKEYLTGFRTPNGQYIYSPETPALREDIAIAIVKIKGYDSRPADRSIIQAMFSDYDGISEAAKDYVAIAVETGLISGYPDDTFKAQNSITRAEAAALLWRAYQYGNDNKVIGGEVISTPQSTNSPTPTNEPIITPTPISTKPKIETLATGVANARDICVKDNFVYILEYNNNKGTINRLNMDDGSIKTFQNIDQRFNLRIKQEDGTQELYDYSKYRAYGLLQSDDKIYISGGYDNVDLISVFCVEPTVSNVVYGFYGLRDIPPVPNMSFIDISGDSVTAGILDSIWKGDTDEEAKSVGRTVSQMYSKTLSALKKNNTVYYINSYRYSDDEFMRANIYPYSSESITKFGNMDITAAAQGNNKFYIATSDGIYELKLDGEFNKIADHNEDIYKMAIDEDGNIIFYDEYHECLKRINL